MKLPAAIEVGPLTYTVSEKRDDELFGLTDKFALTIMIEQRQADSQKRVTLLHEVLHAVVFTVDLDLDYEPEVLEPIVTRMAAQLLDVLRVNPDVVAYLVAP